MSGKKLQARCPSNLQQDVEQFKEDQDLEQHSEATRQLVQRGIRDWRNEEPPGLWLVRQSTGVSAVAALMSGVLTLTSVPGLQPATVAMLAVTIVFASIWSAIALLQR